MLDVNVDRTARPPLHEQVAAQIRRAIAEGEAGPGERLPLAKDLAAVLGVNKNTVLRALHLLREEGLLEFRRGRGITVAGTPQRGAVLTQVRQLLAFAPPQGYDRTAVRKMITDLPQDGQPAASLTFSRPATSQVTSSGPNAPASPFNGSPQHLRDHHRRPNRPVHGQLNRRGDQLHPR